jgi:hypothetical protein
VDFGHFESSDRGHFDSLLEKERRVSQKLERTIEQNRSASVEETTCHEAGSENDIIIPTPYEAHYSPKVC